MKTFCFFLAIVTLVAAPLMIAAQRTAELNQLMVQKLDGSKTLLEGIATSDFKKINESAEKLLRLSRTAEWMVYKTPRYDLFSNDFRRAADNIVQKANDKNIDGVTLAYFELTMSCVRCHQHVREIRDARLPVEGHGDVAVGR